MLCENKMIQTSKLEILIAKLYLYFMPFRMFSQLSLLKSIFGVCANYMPFVFHVLGMLLWIRNENGKIGFHVSDVGPLLKSMGKTMVYLNLSSCAMSILIQLNYGNHGEENAFSGISGMLVYFAQYFFMFLYNARVFELLDRETINQILHRVCIILLFIGLFQVAVMNGVGGAIYNKLNIFGNLATNLPKLCLTTDEGSNAGRVIAIFVFPYLFSQIIQTGKKIYILEVLIWLIPIYYTKSSTAYILIAIDVLVFSILLFFSKNSRRTKVEILLFVLIIFGCALFIMMETGILEDDITEQIHYLLFKKATDRSNGSTASRTVPLLINWGAFTEYPFFGIGNGLQGYFYEKYFPDWAYTVKGSDVGIFLERSKNGIGNGGLFFPSILSGYGIVGCCVIALFVYKLIRMYLRRKNENGNFRYMFLIAAAAFCVNGFSGDAYGMYWAWLMLSLPLYDGKKDRLEVAMEKEADYGREMERIV